MNNNDAGPTFQFFLFHESEEKKNVVRERERNRGRVKENRKTQSQQNDDAQDVCLD